MYTESQARRPQYEYKFCRHVKIHKRAQHKKLAGLHFITDDVPSSPSTLQNNTAIQLTVSGTMKGVNSLRFNFFNTFSFKNYVLHLPNQNK
jgi:hypothetical protein